MKKAAALVLINSLFACLTWFAMYFSGLDLGVSLTFIFYVILIGRSLYREGKNLGSIALIAAGAQLPGFVLMLMSLWYWSNYGLLTSNFDFFLQMWHTPFIPFIAQLPLGSISGISLTYLILYFLSPLYILIMVAAAKTARYRKQADG